MHPLPPPRYAEGDAVRIVPMRTAGEIRWVHLDECAPGQLCWLFYVHFRDHEGLLAGRYFTDEELTDAPDPA